VKRLGLLLLVGCAQPRTELMIGVVTDLKAPDALDSAQLIVTRTKDGFVEQQVDWSISGIRDIPNNLPGSYGIYSDGEETQLQIELNGFKGNNLVVSRKAVLNLVSDKTLFFRMGLTAGCVAKDDCTPNQTCVEGVCQDVHVNPLQLPDYTTDLVTEVTCTSGASYIDTSTGAPMPQSDDADMCPANLCVEGTCLKPPPPPDPTPRTVTGTQFLTRVLPNATTTTPVDLTALNPQVLLEDGTIIPGTGTPDGTFTIPDVPGGTYMLQVGTNYYVTDADYIDLSSAVSGREDVAVPTTPASITLNLTNLDSWQDLDYLEAYSAGADVWYFGLNQEGTPITAGATALTNYTFDNTVGYTSSVKPPGLVDGGKGDHFIVVQLVQHMVGTVLYQAAEKVFTAPSFTQTDGGNTPLTGALVDVPQDHSMTLDIAETKFEAAIGWDGASGTLLNPQAVPIPGTPPATSVNVLANVGGNAYGQIAATADYLFVNVPAGADIQGLPVTFGTPTYPGERWGAMLNAQFVQFVQYQLPGSTPGAGINVGVAANYDLATAPTKIVPRLGPVLSVRIDGEDFFAPSGPIISTPLLTWEPPAVGSAREYTVIVNRLGSDTNNKTTRTRVATFITTQTRLKIPQGVLTPGESYVFQIVASDNPNPNAPNRHTLPDASSFIASAMMAVL
jgi:hypothetical protein